MKILHLANDYAGSTVYKNLCQSLDRHGLLQTVYVAVRSPDLIGRNNPHFSELQSKVIYSDILNAYTRVNYSAKIRRILLDISREVDIDGCSLIHAHTWYSDGAVAYELHKKLGLPYIVTVRNTDINIFARYMLHLRGYGKEILLNAQKIVFVTPVYHQRFSNLSYLSSAKSELEGKAIIIPNGIDEYWIKNVSYSKSNLSDVLQLIYVGRFLKSKNLVRLIKSVKIVNHVNLCCHLTLVGGGGSAHNDVLRLIKGDSSFNFCGLVSDKSKLKELYRSNDVFVMPSKSETFGLVYIEALSQGLPVIYTKNEGIDGLYERNVGESVDYSDVNDIANAIKKIASNYHTYDFDPQAIASNHDWNMISLKYIDMYKEVGQ